MISSQDTVFFSLVNQSVTRTVLKIVLMRKDLNNITTLYYHKSMRDWTPEEIERFRGTHKLTRKTLGELMGVTVMTIYHWERGLRKPSKTTKILLSRIEKEMQEKKERR